MQNKKGFTLIELLVVVLIIGILAAIAVPKYQKAVVKSRAMQAVALLRSFVDAEEAYFLTNGEYSKQLSNLDITFPTLEDWSYGAGFDREDPQIWIYNSQENISFVYYLHVKRMVCQTKRNQEICESFPVTKEDCYGEDLKTGWSCYFFN